MWRRSGSRVFSDGKIIGQTIGGIIADGLSGRTTGAPAAANGNGAAAGTAGADTGTANQPVAGVEGGGQVGDDQAIVITGSRHRDWTPAQWAAYSAAQAAREAADERASIATPVLQSQQGPSMSLNAGGINETFEKGAAYYPELLQKFMLNGYPTWFDQYATIDGNTPDWLVAQLEADLGTASGQAQSYNIYNALTDLGGRGSAYALQVRDGLFAPAPDHLLDAIGGTIPASQSYASAASENHETVSFVSPGFALGADSLAFGAGNLTVSRDLAYVNLRSPLKGPFYGNQHTGPVIRAGKVFTIAGKVVGYGVLAGDAYTVIQSGGQTGKGTLAKDGVLWGVAETGPWGAGAALAYEGVDYFYPGGVPGLGRDWTHIESRRIQLNNNMDPDNPDGIFNPGRYF